MWVLSLPKKGINQKTKVPSVSWKDSYHATLEQVASHVANHTAAESISIMHLEQVMGDFLKELTGLLEEHKAHGTNGITKDQSDE